MPSDPSNQPHDASTSPSQPSSSRARNQQTLLAKRRQADPNLPKPPPLQVGPTSGGPSSSKVASAALSAAPTSPPAFRRPIPTYPRWADSRDTPRVARTVHDLALFLSSLPLPLHRYTPRLLARTIARLLARQRLMPTNIAFDLALLFWRLIINVSRSGSVC